ncbi:TPA: ATP-binding protein [bacterium]|nr:ATP-binding protein [bacterium]
MDQAERLRELAKEKKKNSVEIIAVTSGKGGVGKTSISVNLGIAFAISGRKVLIVDADLGLSNVNIIAGVVPPPRYNLFHFIKGEKEIKDIIAEGPCGIKLITGAIGISTLANLSPKKRIEFIEGLSSLNSICDMIFIDTSAGLSGKVMSFILSSDKVLLITTPEPTAIADAYGIIKAVSFKTKDLDIRLIVNKVKNAEEGERVANRIIEIAGQFLGMRVGKLGVILDDHVVCDSVHQQTPFFLSHPKSKASQCIYNLRNVLADIPTSDNNEGIGGFLKRLFRTEREYMEFARDEG